MTRRARLLGGLSVALIALLLAGDLSPAEAGRRVRNRSTRRSAARRSAPAPLGRGLVWHVETLDGREIDSRLPDEAINPASVTKVATSLWALEKLGPDYRFDTRFLSRSGGAPVNGELSGDLLVEGGGDPDFQIENALLAAKELNDRGVQRVRGSLVVNRLFWIGREDGSQGREPDASRRAMIMGARLRQVLDPARWNGFIRYAWRELAIERGFPVNRPPRIVVSGPTLEQEKVSGTPLFVHRSRPLQQTLRQLDAFSNNDIERVGANIGSPTEMSGWLAKRLGQPFGSLRFQTTSGLGQNRITPRQIVALVRELKKTTERLNLSLEHVLPAAGCDPGTVSRFFQKIAHGPAASSVIGKTGTLTSTDGGVSVFAGVANTANGEIVFAVAEPRAAGRLRAARVKEEQWLLSMIEKNGGPAARTCIEPLTGPQHGVALLPPSATVQKASDTAASPEVLPAAVPPEPNEGEGTIRYPEETPQAPDVPESSGTTTGTR